MIAEREPLDFYFDFRSPYSYLAKDAAYAIEREFPVEFRWLPFTLDIQGAYGGEAEERTPRGWAKVRYLYMDVRRLANKRGLVVRGTAKIFDPSLVNAAFLYAGDADRGRAFVDTLWQRFWRRRFDIEDVGEIEGLLAEIGVHADGLHGFFEGEGRRRVAAIAHEAERRGVFGIPTFVFRSELFWGADRIDMLRERLTECLRHEAR